MNASLCHFSRGHVGHEANGGPVLLRWYCTGSHMLGIEFLGRRGPMSAKSVHRARGGASISPSV